jgi:hypothetical protein
MRLYLPLSAVIFGIVSVLHLLRAILGWQIQIADVIVPLSTSWGGFVVALGLSAWGFLLWWRTCEKKTP